MKRLGGRAVLRGVMGMVFAGALSGVAVADEICSAAMDRELGPADPARCDELLATVRDPGGTPLNDYQAAIGEFFGKFCHRDESKGWRRDKFVRDTGPYTQTLVNGKYEGQYYGTHSPVVIWYSPDFIDWLYVNRPLTETGEPIEVAAADRTAIPPGAIVAKEMYPAPAARCADRDPMTLKPTSGIAFYVRDAEAAQDGWYWGWFGYEGWGPDWPPGPDNGAPLQGFGQYCVNCHASAEDNQSFASLKNIQDEPGIPLVFMSQDWDLADPPMSHHRLVVLPDDPAPRLGEPLYAYNPVFLDTFGKTVSNRPTWESVSKFPSATYDNVWVPGGPVTAHSEFLTSDQCAGCHDAGGTGLQFSMTEPATAKDKQLIGSSLVSPDYLADILGPGGGSLINYSPYGTWRTSPMGLAGRDPIFFAQLASETQTFHPDGDMPETIQNVCLGCHGIMGQRQHAIDSAELGEDCNAVFFTRDMVSAVPYADGKGAMPGDTHADYGALARDGISCTACHRMVQNDYQIEAVKDQPQNACVENRQDLLNPASLGLSGFARTFTGSYWVGEADKIRGPFETPLIKPMQHALGIDPIYDEGFASSELCGTCHTVHLPIFQDGKTLGYTYEQTTYPEWLFSSYRTGATPNGDLPFGAGDRAKSCLDCHMASTDANGKPLKDKIASIQEYSNFPQAEYALPPEEIDVKEREGFARHTLVGLNVFLTKMAQQFPDVFGIPTLDPMLVKKGEPSLIRTEQEMLANADNAVATVTVDEVTYDGKTLGAQVTIESHVGHKFPSGVGFRRAILTFEVLDVLGNTIWASGQMNGAGVLQDGAGGMLPGELWWKADCSGLVSPGKLVFQPHHQTITRQDQVQIYQELVVTPAAGVADPMCGNDPAPGGNLTTSFLSICGEVKDNRLLPHGYLNLEQRTELAKAIGATERLAEEATAHFVDGDPDYVSGGGDSLVYEIPSADLGGTPASVKATLSYQAIPPFYLQDRFCTAEGPDRDRLFFLAGHLNLDGTDAAGWAFELVDSGVVSVPVLK